MATSKIGKAIGFGDGPPPVSDPMEAELELEDDLELPEPEDKSGVGSAEVLAMKQFERAASPEAKAQALKDFLEACGLY